MLYFHSSYSPHHYHIITTTLPPHHHIYSINTNIKIHSLLLKTFHIPHTSTRHPLLFPHRASHSSTCLSPTPSRLSYRTTLHHSSPTPSSPLHSLLCSITHMEQKTDYTQSLSFSLSLSLSLGLYLSIYISISLSF